MSTENKRRRGRPKKSTPTVMYRRRIPEGFVARMDACLEACKSNPGHISISLGDAMRVMKECDSRQATVSETCAAIEAKANSCYDKPLLAARSGVGNFLKTK